MDSVLFHHKTKENTTNGFDNFNEVYPKKNYVSKK
jgi:hypothetical protein